MNEALGFIGPDVPAISPLAAFVSASNGRVLPEAVLHKSRLHLLDTLGAMISGTRLLPGRRAIDFARAAGGAPQAAVVGTPVRAPLAVAALANGMLAHADETDDSHAASLTHPGCAVIPAALAMAEAFDRGGDALLKAIATGYDVAARINLALGPRALSNSGHAPHSIGGHWGAGAAAAALAGLDAARVRTALSYVAHQTAGLTCWVRDPDHIQKAFVFGGMPARNGVSAVEMVAAGFTGVDDVLSGHGNFLAAFSAAPAPEEITQTLGNHFHISDTAIKKWSVGSPIQSALNSLEALMCEEGVTAEAVVEIRVRLPDNVARVVDSPDMADISVQYCLAVMLLDDKLTFESSHDRRRAQSDAVGRLAAKIQLIPDAALSEAKPARQAIVEVTLNDGREVRHHTKSVRGTPDNPMSDGEVVDKVTDLVAPVLGAARCAALIEDIRTLGPGRPAAGLVGHWA